MASEVRLAERARRPGDAAKGWVPSIEFDLIADGETVGVLTLRLGDTEHLRRFGGHVGYRVEPEHQGRGYAARGLSLLLDIARAQGFAELVITCNPDNLASRRTAERAGAELVEIVDLPSTTDMYARGERRKCRYVVRL